MDKSVRVTTEGCQRKEGRKGRNMLQDDEGRMATERREEEKKEDERRKEGRRRKE
jgi:hypothetical protein